MKTEQKRQVSFRMTGDEFIELREMHNRRCVELGKWISQTAFLKEIIFGAAICIAHIE